jgi:2-enoate reductase
MTLRGEVVVTTVTEQVHTWPCSRRQHATRMSAALFPYDHLFSPITVNQLMVRNRIVMDPMGNLGMADASGRPTAKMIVYFAERAEKEGPV